MKTFYFFLFSILFTLAITGNYVKCHHLAAQIFGEPVLNAMPERASRLLEFDSWWELFIAIKTILNVLRKTILNELVLKRSLNARSRERFGAYIRELEKLEMLLTTD